MGVNQKMDTWEKRNRSRKRKLAMIKIGFPILIVVVLLLALFNPLRFDFAAGSHRIIPTAIDSDMWGNYQVYYRTSALTTNIQEDLYYIEKGREDLREQVQEAILSGQEIIVYYDKYIGWKGFTAPRTSPIIKIEFME